MKEPRLHGDAEALISQLEERAASATGNALVVDTRKLKALCEIAREGLFARQVTSTQEEP